MKYESFQFDEIISNYAKNIEKPFVFIRASGPHSITDVELANKTFALYKDILPLEIYTVLFNSEIFFLSFDNIENALEFCEDYFPESQTKCSSEEYVHYSIYNPEGQLVFSN